MSLLVVEKGSSFYSPRAEVVRMPKDIVTSYKGHALSNIGVINIEARGVLFRLNTNLRSYFIST